MGREDGRRRGREGGEKREKTDETEKIRFTFIERRKVNGSVAGREMRRRSQGGVLRKRRRMNITERRGMVRRWSTRTRERRRRQRSQRKRTRRRTESLSQRT